MNKQSERMQSYLHQIEQNADERQFLASLPDEDAELQGLLQLVVELKRAPHPTLASVSAPLVHSQLVEALDTQQQSAPQPTARQRPVWHLPWTIRLAGVAALLCLVALFVWGGVDRESLAPMLGTMQVNPPTATFAPATIEGTASPALLPAMSSDSPLVTPETPSLDLVGTVVVSPLPAPKPGEEIDDRCAVSAVRHPAAQRLAEQYRTDEAAVMAWFCAGYGFGEIGLAYEISIASGVTLGEILELRQSGLEWGGIMQRLGVISRIDPIDD